MNHYEVKWIKPNKAAKQLMTTTDFTKLREYVDSPKFPGIWVTPTRKVLRFGQGELRIEITDRTMRIIRHEPIPMGSGRYIYGLHVAYGGDLNHICINERLIVGYTEDNDVLWKATSFEQLSRITTKEIAFQALEHYKNYIQTYNLPEVM